MAKTFDCIAALAANNGIGIKGEMPWRLPKETKYFTQMSKTSQCEGKQNAVIMGRKSWDAIPSKFRPLSDRLNVVISRSLTQSPHEGVLLANSLSNALHLVTSPPYGDQIDRLWVMGGQPIFEEALKSPLCRRLYLTRIMKDYECDCFFPDFDESAYKLISEETQEEIEKKSQEKVSYKLCVYEKII
ncbi:dihydrofolate reductase-like [Oscarella lobularis]|uniref:dihydrofolate reductase-like n=1 Tax=Oscarella lobularis TaxID=121494 RepID=UPI0033134F89